MMLAHYATHERASCKVAGEAKVGALRNTSFMSDSAEADDVRIGRQS